jgi:hypothetical protein
MESLTFGNIELKCIMQGVGVERGHMITRQNKQALFDLEMERETGFHERTSKHCLLWRLKGTERH